jgi:hypothetical protein
MINESWSLLIKNEFLKQKEILNKEIELENKMVLT